MSTGILVLNGKVVCDDVGVSMTSTKTAMPALVAKGGNLTMINCDIKGHGNIPTVGVYCQFADLTLKQCKIYRHRGGGIILNNRNENIVHIYDCEIAYNINVGVLCDGKDGRPMIEKCKIARNEGSGIKIGDNMAQIKQNDIRNNEDGILVENGDPTIYLNTIYHNFGNGINIKSIDDLRCEGKIQSNDIFENENGIIASGHECYTKIENNGKIAHNRVAGIRAINKAAINVLRNDIFENVA